MTIEAYFEKVGVTLKNNAKTALSSFLGNFIQDDLGKLAIDAVNYAAALPEGTSGDEKREIAKTQLLNDAEAAGHDLSLAADSMLNFLIETALQAMIAGAVASAVAAA